MVYRGLKTQDAAIDLCKSVNAGLPLPKSKEETAEYLKITGALKSIYGGVDYLVHESEIEKRGE